MDQVTKDQLKDFLYKAGPMYADTRLVLTAGNEIRGYTAKGDVRAIHLGWHYLALYQNREDAEHFIAANHKHGWELLARCDHRDYTIAFYEMISPPELLNLDYLPWDSLRHRDAGTRFQRLDEVLALSSGTWEEKLSQAVSLGALTEAEAKTLSAIPAHERWGKTIRMALGWSD